MGMIYIMLTVSLLVALFFLGSFIWATKTGQYDDDYTPSVRMLFDDETSNTNQNSQTHGTTEV